MTQFCSNNSLFSWQTLLDPSKWSILIREKARYFCYLLRMIFSAPTLRGLERTTADSDTTNTVQCSCNREVEKWGGRPRPVSVILTTPTRAQPQSQSFQPSRLHDNSYQQFVRTGLLEVIVVSQSQVYQYQLTVQYINCHRLGSFQVIIFQEN